MTTMIDRPHPGDVLTLAFELINARGADYDNANAIENNFREIAAVASVVLGKPLDARDIALIQVCVKLIRSKSDAGKLDNYVDGANYLAFAACFAGLVPLPSGVKPPTPIKDQKPRQTSVATEVLKDTQKDLYPKSA